MSTGEGQPTDTTMGVKTPFMFIAADNGTLYGLDRAGRVWKYIPKTDRRFAFWTRLTDHRATGEAKGE